MSHIVSDLVSLESLRQEWLDGGSLLATDVEVRLPDPAATWLWQRRFDRARRACGCAEGGLALLVAAAAFVVSHRLGIHPPAHAWHVAADVGLAVAWAVGAKLAGIALGRHLRARVIAGFAHALQSGRVTP